jgi:hypothetical protein
MSWYGPGNCADNCCAPPVVVTCNSLTDDALMRATGLLGKTLRITTRLADHVFEIGGSGETATVIPSSASRFAIRYSTTVEYDEDDSHLKSDDAELLSFIGGFPNGFAPGGIPILTGPTLANSVAKRIGPATVETVALTPTHRRFVRSIYLTVVHEIKVTYSVILSVGCVDDEPAWTLALSANHRMGICVMEQFSNVSNPVDPAWTPFLTIEDYEDPAWMPESWAPALPFRIPLMSQRISGATSDLYSEGWNGISLFRRDSFLNPFALLEVGALGIGGATRRLSEPNPTAISLDPEFDPTGLLMCNVNIA